MKREKSVDMGNKTKKKTISQLKKAVDKVFSDWIRKRDNYTCFTCNKKGDKYSIHCGHFISRNQNALRYDERNCHAQCVADNIFRGGATIVYAIRLQEKYGQGILKELEKEGRKIKRFTITELKELYKKYKN